MNREPISKESQLKKNKGPKRKRCKLESCNKLFAPVRDFQKMCSYDCDMEFIKDKKNLKDLINEGKKREVKTANKKKKEFNQSDKSKLRKKVQDLAQKYGRLREISRGNIFCVTCGSHNIKDGGHFLPKSTYPAIRYYTLQVNPQCVFCNQYNGGAPKEYREYMIKRFGIEKVNFLESQHRVTRNYSVEYLNKYFKVMSKRIKKYLT